MRCMTSTRSKRRVVQMEETMHRPGEWGTKEAGPTAVAAHGKHGQRWGSGMRADGGQTGKKRDTRPC